MEKRTIKVSVLYPAGEGKTFNEVVEKIKSIVESLTKKKVDITHVPNPQGENEINKRNFIADYSKFINGCMKPHPYTCSENSSHS